jgi:hypothetical protein
VKALGLLLVCALAAGCSSVTTHRQPGADLARYHRFYVVRLLTDNHHLDEQIVQELQRLGREASSGPFTMKPDNVDALVTYTDRWEWDFKTYLIDLNIEVRDARTDKPLASGRFYQPSARTQAPAEMIRQLLASAVGAGSKPENGGR